MRELEVGAGPKWREKRDTRDLSIPFIYAGTIDSWTRDLDEDSKRLLTERFSGSLAELGYDV